MGAGRAELKMASLRTAFSPNFNEAREFVEYLQDTLIPDLEESKMVETAKDFERVCELIRQGRRDGSFVNYLKHTLIPDLKESGMKNTAQDFEEGVYWLVTGKRSSSDFEKEFERLEDTDWNELARKNPGLMKRLNQMEVAFLRKTDTYGAALDKGMDEDEALDEASDANEDELAKIRYDFYKKNRESFGRAAMMAPGMVICPQCKGRGKLTIEGTETTDKGTRKLPPVTIDCISCGGKGRISERELERHKRERALWCKCGNKSGRTEFFDDGEHPNCSKHCWVCEDCGGITQVG